MSELRGFFAMLEEANENTNESEAVINLDECKNEGKGFKTLIPDEAYAKCKELMRVHEEIIQIMADSVLNTITSVHNLPNSDAMAFPMIEYIMFHDMLKEAWEGITDLVAIHEFASKEEILKICMKNDTTPLRMLNTKMMNDILGAVFN